MVFLRPTVCIGMVHAKNLQLSCAGSTSARRVETGVSGYDDARTVGGEQRTWGIVGGAPAEVVRVV
jgi:hypothetical protein